MFHLKFVFNETFEKHIETHKILNETQRNHQKSNKTRSIQKKKIKLGDNSNNCQWTQKHHGHDSFTLNSPKRAKDQKNKK